MVLKGMFSELNVPTIRAQTFENKLASKHRGSLEPRRLEANLSWFLRHAVSFWSYHAIVAGPKVTDGSMEGTVIQSRDESYFKCTLSEKSNCSWSIGFSEEHQNPKV